MVALLFLFSVLAKIFISCPIESRQSLLSMGCIQYVDCSTSNGVDYILFQHCNKTWFQSKQKKIDLLTKSNKQGFIKNEKRVRNFKLGQRCALLNFDNSQLYFYELNRNEYDLKLQNITSFIDYQLYQPSNSTFELVLLNSRQLTTLQFDFKLSLIKSQVYNFSDPIRLIRHISAQLYVIGSQNGDILIFNTSKNQNVSKYENINGSIVQMQVKVINKSASFYKIYVYFDSKVLCEYVLIDSALQLQRTSHYFNYTVFSIKTYFNNNYLLITDDSGNISLVDLSNGSLINSTNLNQKFSNNLNTSLYVLFDNETSYFIINSVNSLILQSIITTSNRDNLVLTCKNLYCYNSQISRCTLCRQNCGQCSQTNGTNKKCNDGFFNNNGECLNCFYNEQGLTQYFNQCFSFTDKQLMQKSKIGIRVFSEMLTKLVFFLNMCGLLFVFLKLINNWSLISLYFFVNIKIPFFLQNILLSMFKKINISIFQTIGINLNPSLNINFQLDEKFSLTAFSLDFLELNYQSFILFFYSVLVLLFLYRFIDFCLQKISMSLFNQKNIVYVCDEFVGIFGNTLVPLSYIIFNFPITDPRSKLNFMLHTLFGGFILVSPVIFFLFREQPKYRYKLNKVQNQNQFQIAQAIKKGFIAKKTLFRQRQCFQKCLYALLTFSISLLANSPEPRIFFYVVGFVHIVNIWNSCIGVPVKVNNVIQNLQLAIFHVGFTLLYYIDSQAIKLNISIGLVKLIIQIALHQMLTSLITKIYFIYSLFKTYFERKQQIQTFLSSNKTNSLFDSRMHAIKIELSKMSSKKKLKLSKQSYRVVFKEKKRNLQLPIQEFSSRQREIEELKYLQRKEKRFRRINRNTKHLT